MREISEVLLQHELYRVFKDAIIDGIEINNYSVVDIEPQLRIAKGAIADLVVTIRGLYRPEVLLVLEVKRRPDTVRPYITGVKQARRYAEELGAWFYAVCDGWFMLLVKSTTNKLIGAYGVDINKHYARNLLLGLIEYYYSVKSDYLNKLKKNPDPVTLKRKIFPKFIKIGIRGLNLPG